MRNVREEDASEAWRKSKANLNEFLLVLLDFLPHVEEDVNSFSDVCVDLPGRER